MVKPEGKYYGDSGSIRAVCVLILHASLLFFAGTLLNLARWDLVLWMSVLFVLLWVPKNLFQMGKQLRETGISVARKRAIGLRILLLAVLCLPYFGPGLLFCYPLSDTGFRLFYGNALQRSVVEFLNTEASHKIHADQMRSLRDMSLDQVSLRRLPNSVRQSIPGHPMNTLFLIDGETPRGRHLSLYYTSSGRARPEVMLEIGSPDFVPEPDRYSENRREMWPGVYVVYVDEI